MIVKHYEVKNDIDVALLWSPPWMEVEIYTSLILFQTNLCFYVAAVQVFWNSVEKAEIAQNFPTVFSTILENLLAIF